MCEEITAEKPTPDNEAHTAVQTAAQTAETAVDDFRLPASVLMLGGLALALLSIVTSAGDIEGWERAAVYLLAAVGAACFLIAGRTAVQGALPQGLQTAVSWPARYFNISSGQVFMLLLAFCFTLLARFAAGDLLEARSPFVADVAWLLALVFAALGALGDGSLLDLPLTWSDIYFTAAVFGLALLVRGLASDLIPTTFSGDEGSSGMMSVLFMDGRATNLFTSGWFDFPSLFFMLQGASIAIFGQTVPALRLLSALGGALTVVAVYWLARVTFDVAMARIASLILLASHFHIHMSRIGLNNIWDGLFAALAAAGLWYGWKTGRRFGFVLAGLSLGIGQYFYVTMRAMPVVFLIWAAAALIADRDRFRVRLPGLILTAYIALIAVLPMAIYFGSHSDRLVARSNHVTILGDWMENEEQVSGRSEAFILARQFSLAARGLVNEPLSLLYDPGAPLLLSAAAMLFLLGFLWGVYDFDLRYLLLMLPILVTLVVVSLSRDAPSSQRYVLAAPFVTVFVALPIGLLTEWLRRLWPDYRALASVPALLLVAWIMIADMNYYFTGVYDHYLLGGPNTMVATKIAAYLQEEGDPPRVIFYGYPRMGFHSHGTVPYLAPDVQGLDVPEGELYPEDWQLDGRTRFIFLPERLTDLQAVTEDFPGGTYQEIVDSDGELLFSVYTAGG